MAATTRLSAKVLRWGNSFGLRITKEDVELLGLREGDEIVVEVTARAHQKIDVSHLPKFDLGGDLSVRHDEVDPA